MATYIPNVNPYLPEVKTFTPDYKFLADALTQRQTKYSTNYKQLNNAYSKVVYTDLSREDTNEARTQFVNNLQPEIEKISGLDLSLAQNVRAAQGVFQPFYDNDLVVKDMVMTKDYKNKVQYAQSLAQSSKQEDKDKYWGEGLELLKYKMDDFINSSQEDALKSYIPSYVQNPQLYKRSMAYLKEQGYNVKIDEVSKDGNFIITTKNGKNITATAMADLKMNFLQDDLLNKAYHTKSYVDSRKFADKEMKEGRVSSVSEGVLKYNTGTIQAHQQSTAARIVQYDEQIATLDGALKSVEAQMKGRTPKPGSSQDLAIKLMQNKLEGTEVQKEMAVNSLTKAVEILNSNSPEAINNQGYSIQMQSNIMKDLGMAARNFSMKNVEKTLKVNQVKMQDRKERHDILLTDMRFKNQARIQELATGEAYKKLVQKTEYYMGLGLNADGSAKTEDQIKAESLSQILSNTGIPTGSDNGLMGTNVTIPVKKNYVEVQEAYQANKVEALDNESISGYMAAQVHLNKDNSETRNMIKIPDGMVISEGIDTKEVGGDTYASKENFRKIANQDAPNLAAFKKANNNFFSEEPNDRRISELQYEYVNRREKGAALLQDKEELNKAQYDNLEIIRKLQGDNAIPNIYEEKDGEYVKLSKDEFLEKKLTQLTSAKKMFWKDIRYGSALPTGTEAVLKDKKDPIWQDLKDGIIKKFISRLGMDGKEKKILNPNLFELKEFYKSNVKKARNPQWRYNHPDKTIQDNMNKSIVETIQFVKDANFQGMSNANTQSNVLDQIPVINNNSIKRDLEKKYDRQVEHLDHVNKGTYTNQAEGENANLGFKYINFAARDYGQTDLGSQADQFTGKDITYMFDDTQYENPASNAGVIQQGNYLEQALNADGVIVAHVNNEKEFGVGTLNDNDAKADAYNILQKWKVGGLGEKYNYNIKYAPAIADEQYSTYTIDRRQSVAGTTKSAGRKYKQSITIKVPVHQDYNNKNIKNDHTNYVLNRLINETTGQYNRSFPSGTNINVTREYGNYSFDFSLYQYDKATDDFISIDSDVLMNQFNIGPYNTNKPGEADQKYREYTLQAFKWNQNQIKNQATVQKEFDKYVEKNKLDPNALLPGDWENFMKTYK
tara:strand:+ start:387 stop:3746 length:3360 start_codon:yes stop_codon:yes gene_type:complete